MAKAKAALTRGVVGDFLHFGVYKGAQGRVTRQVTFAVISLLFAFAAWRAQVTLSTAAWVVDLAETFAGSATASTFGTWRTAIVWSLPFLLAGVGLWVAYRTVNIGRFADFLIAVEAEMNKVSWPSRKELVRSSIVVIVMIFALAGLLWSFDMLWGLLFKSIGVSA